MSQSPGIDPQDKAAWCKQGEEWERDFVERQPIRDWRVLMNPEKKDSPYPHDFVCVIPADLKRQGTQFHTAEQLYGIPAQFAVSINSFSLRDYHRKKPNLIMIVECRWLGKNYLLTAHRANRLFKEGKAFRHPYQNRKPGDGTGNKVESIILDVRDMDELYGNS